MGWSFSGFFVDLVADEAADLSFRGRRRVGPDRARGILAPTEESASRTARPVDEARIVGVRGSSAEDWPRNGRPLDSSVGARGVRATFPRAPQLNRRRTHFSRRRAGRCRCRRRRRRGYGRSSCAPGRIVQPPLGSMTTPSPADTPLCVLIIPLPVRGGARRRDPSSRPRRRGGRCGSSSSRSGFRAGRWGRSSPRRRRKLRSASSSFGSVWRRGSAVGVYARALAGADRGRGVHLSSPWSRWPGGADQPPCGSMPVPSPAWTLLRTFIPLPQPSGSRPGPSPAARWVCVFIRAPRVVVIRPGRWSAPRPRRPGSASSSALPA